MTLFFFFYAAGHVPASNGNIIVRFNLLYLVIDPGPGLSLNYDDDDEGKREVERKEKKKREVGTPVSRAPT